MSSYLFMSEIKEKLEMDQIQWAASLCWCGTPQNRVRHVENIGSSYMGLKTVNQQ